MAKDNINQDMALDDATDLAFDIDVHLREHSSTYNSEHTEVMEVQENIADDIISGNFDNVKGLLTRYAIQNEDFFKRLDEYRENFLQDTGPFSVLIYNKETQAEQWLLLPAKPERFEKLLNDIELSKDASPEQYAVSGYVISYGDLADYIATGENVDELNYLAYLLKNLNSEEMKIFLSAMEDEADIHSIENLINLAQNTDCYTLVDNMYDWDDYGKYVMEENGIDLLGISGHKFHAPKGVGALYVNSKTLITPLIVGGHQERGKRAGTENVPYIAGMAKAAELAMDGLKYELTEVKRLRDKLEKNILKNIYNSRLNTGVSNRVPNTTNIGFEYVEGELILLHMSDLGICASSGSACTSGSLEPSHVLRAMNVPFTAIHGSIRFSLSRFTTEKEIDYVCEKMPEIIEKITAISPYQEELAALKAHK